MTAAEEPRTEEESLLWAIFSGPPCEWCGKFVDCKCKERRDCS